MFSCEVKMPDNQRPYVFCLDPECPCIFNQGCISEGCLCFLDIKDALPNELFTRLQAVATSGHARRKEVGGSSIMHYCKDKANCTWGIVCVEQPIKPEEMGLGATEDFTLPQTSLLLLHLHTLKFILHAALSKVCSKCKSNFFMPSLKPL